VNNTPIPGAPASSGPRKSGSYSAILVVATLLIAAGAYYVYMVRSEGNIPAADTLGGLRPLVAELAKSRTMDPRYKDADGDLIADAPTEAGKLRDPSELRFVGIPTDFASDPEKGKVVWKDLLDHVAKATGKTVVFAEDVKAVDGQLAGLRNGTLQITAFGTGQVPGAVNTAGFVPLVCPADNSGSFHYEMEILVRSDSPTRSPKDLAGKEIAFSALSSNSGSRAPMVLLESEFQMLPGRDYHFVFTGDQLKSLQLLATGRFDAICVANDFYRRMLDDPANKLKSEQFRSIYKSKSFPPLCFGAAYDLTPELRSKIESALKSFSIAGSSVGTKLNEAKFSPVSYKLDWAFVRDVDEAFRRLPDTK